MTINRKQPYYALYSKSLEVYNLPFPAEDLKSAKSMIKASVVTGKDQYLKTCLEDFQLCHVGFFDTNFGVFERFDCPCDVTELTTFISVPKGV